GTGVVPKAVQEGLAEATWYQPSIPREKMRELLVRKDGPAIRDTLIWFALLIGFGYGIYVLWGTWWVVIPIMLYSVIYASTSDSRWHESSHGTPFKTDWMNNWLYEIASFMVFRQSVPWRWSHTRHHSDTLVVGRDPEIAVPRPPNIKRMLLGLVGLKNGPMEARKMLMHVVGKIEKQEKTYIPESEYGKVFFIARVYMGIYLTVIGLAIYFQTWLPLFYIGLPTLLGSYLLTIYSLTQHAGLQENVLDHRLNSRTIYMNRINRFLYWNMNYHVEHHIFPLVPYHNLPKLHELIKDYCPKPYNGLIETYKEIIPALLKQIKDPYYYVKRELPIVPESEPEQQVHRFVGRVEDQVNGIVKVCTTEDLAEGEVVRFDCDEDTYAIYKTDGGKYYATDGICTHGSTHLAEGLVIGELIECPKHNGRFSIVDGSVQRAPVCAGLRTYTVTEEKGTIWINLNSAGGAGLKESEQAVQFKVISNDNVATYIKELVIEPLYTEKIFRYRSGDYIQLEIPAYRATFAQMHINAPYNMVWKNQNLFHLHVNNMTKTRRNYSMATNPKVDKQLRFNVRIALPPEGLVCSAGIGSSYVYGLKPGDTINVMGPFGDFHLKDTEKEMVYIGGGAGIAPLRSHLSYLFETLNTERTVTFWYGARSKQEIYYENYFRKLEAQFPNFSFHIALSDSLPKDNWSGHTGFIHEVVRREYLEEHDHPEELEYYLCGPPMMIQSAKFMLKSEYCVDEKNIAYDEF
ncbi:MAG: NADH:ubiquinone reductase (Na(+)-transporting) subunit F, partial [Flavobacteriaceae bacterium]